MSNAYSVTLLLKSLNGRYITLSLFVVANGEAEAEKKAREQYSETEFVSDIQGWSIDQVSSREIGREYIEEAAREVLGWGPPE
jgi:hypothetical protein